VTGRAEHVGVAIPAGHVPNAAQSPLPRVDGSLQRVADLVAEQQVHETDDADARTESVPVLTAPALRHRKHGLDFTERFQRVRASRAVIPAAFHVDGPDDAVPSRGILREIFDAVARRVTHDVEQRVASHRGEMPAPIPQVVVWIDDRQAGVEGGFHGVRQWCAAAQVNSVMRTMCAILNANLRPGLGSRKATTDSPGQP
jgi:hypothetical protein